MVARRAHNPEAVGSNPASATKKTRGNPSSFFVLTPNDLFPIDFYTISISNGICIISSLVI